MAYRYRASKSFRAKRLFVDWNPIAFNVPRFALICEGRWPQEICTLVFMFGDRGDSAVTAELELGGTRVGHWIVEWYFRRLERAKP